MNDIKRNRIQAVTIAAMFMTFGAGVAGAQGPATHLAIGHSRGDAAGPQDREAQFDGAGGPGGRMGGLGQFRGPGMGGPGQGPGGMAMRPKPSVVEIPAKGLAVLLGLSADQTDRIAAIQKTARPPRPEMGRPGGPNGDRGGRAIWGTRSKGGPGEGSGGRNADSAPGLPGGDPREARKKAKTDIMAVLTDAQKARLPQVMREVEALHAARIPLEALATLSLSGDQQKKIADIGADGHKKLVALLSADDDQDSAASASPQDIHEGMGDDVNALLTSDQRAKVRAARRQHGRERGPGMMPPPGGMGMDGGGMMPPPGGDRMGRGPMGGGPMGGPQGESGMGFDGPPPPGGFGGGPGQGPGSPEGQFGAGGGPRRGGAHRGGRPGPGADGDPAGMMGSGPDGPEGFGPPPPDDGGDVL